MVRARFVAKVRRGHLITPSGPGALTLLPNRVSIIVTGPATWMRTVPVPDPGAVSIVDQLSITDRHLQVATGVKRFVQPPAADDPPKDSDWVLPGARFPLMEACMNRDCRRMVQRDIADANEGRCTACGTTRKWATYQVALVLACPDGHLADIDWAGWLHGDDECATPVPRYSVTSSPDRPRVECDTCHKQAVFDPAVNFPCPGTRPWLPGVGAEPCRRRARPLERSSTTMYYAQQESALTIPVAGTSDPVLTHALLDNPALAPLRRLDQNERRPDILDQIAELADRLGIRTTQDKLIAHLDALAGEQDVPPARDLELDALSRGQYASSPVGHLPDLIAEPRDVTAYTSRHLGGTLTGVSAVSRLRETRVLTGFTRIEPAPASPDRGYVQMWGHTRPGSFLPGATDDWLPGYRVYGEGILVTLDRDKCLRWANDVAVDQRVVAAAQLLPARLAFDPARTVLAHTFAHLLMRALAPESGYPLPALRERLYVSDERTAVLIYTAAGDIHGTLGGLVDLAAPERLSALIDQAIDSATWCATDPVCGEGHPDLGGQGATPGACHHCLYVPETSCEAFNKGLDRQVVTDFVASLP